MRKSNGFTLMNKGEIGSYLSNLKVTRKIDGIQVHHMAAPDYRTWENTDKKKFSDPHFGRTNSLNEYGKNTWGSSDENGKYIAQNFNIFPDGMITSGRSLNSTPIGIKGWNTGKICIETYGNFDKGCDVINRSQEDSLIALIGELCKKFKITPSSNTIRYHAWFSSSGNFIGDYKPGKSGKTCPGTGFMGGNTISAFNSNVLPKIKKYMNGEISSSQNNTTVSDKLVKVTTDVLNIRKNPDANSTKVGSVKKGEVFTIIKESGDWGYLKSGAGWIHLGYTEVVRDNKPATFKVKVTTDVLNIRKNPDANSPKVGSVKKGEVFTIVKESGDWGYLKSGAGWIHLGYTSVI